MRVNRTSLITLIGGEMSVAMVKIEGETSVEIPDEMHMVSVAAQAV